MVSICVMVYTCFDLEEKEKHEDGMATIEAVILIAVAVILALVVVNALTKGDDGKAIVLLGIYDVILQGDTMILQQPEASIGIGGYGAPFRKRSPKTRTVRFSLTASRRCRGL